MPAHVIDVPADRFQELVIDASRHTPVVVDFWAAWCGPCRTLGPILERFAAQDGGRWILAKVDVDQAQGIAQRYGVQGIPSVKAFVDGEVADAFTGALPPAQVRAFLDRIAPEPAAQAASAGRAAFEAGDVEGASRHWQAALALDDGQPLAHLGLADLALSAGDVDAARAHLDAISGDLGGDAGWAERVRLRLGGGGDVDALRARADAGDLDASWDLAHALAAKEDWDGALEALLEIVRTDRSWRDDGARKEMLRIFDAIGPRSPTADRWRSALARVLF